MRDITYQISLPMGGLISRGCYTDWKYLGFISAFGEQKKHIHKVYLREGERVRYWFCTTLLPITQFCRRLLRDLCWDDAQSSVEAYFLWGQTLSCSTVIPSTVSVPLSKGNNPIILNARDGKCMTHEGVCTPSGEWEQHVGEVDFMCRGIQKRQYGYSEISAVLVPKRNGALVLGSSAEPRSITFRNSQPLFLQGTKPRWKLWPEMYKISFLQSAFILLA